jgi:hypothetical protein
MNWIKINKADKIPAEEFLVTDGNKIDIKINSHSINRFALGRIKVENATHYILLSDIPLPNQPERLSEKTSKDDAIV